MQSSSSLSLRLGYTRLWRIVVTPHFYTKQFLRVKILFLVFRHRRLGGHIALTVNSLYLVPDLAVRHFSRYLLNQGYRNALKRERKASTPKLFKRRFYRKRPFGAFTRKTLPRPRQWYWRKVAYVKFRLAAFTEFCRKSFVGIEWRYTSAFDDAAAYALGRARLPGDGFSGVTMFLVEGGLFAAKVVSVVPGVRVFRYLRRHGWGSGRARYRTRYLVLVPSAVVLGNFWMTVARFWRRGGRFFKVWRLGRAPRLRNVQYIKPFWNDSFHNFMKVRFPIHYMRPSFAVRYGNLRTPIFFLGGRFQRNRIRGLGTQLEKLFLIFARNRIMWSRAGLEVRHIRRGLGVLKSFLAYVFSGVGVKAGGVRRGSQVFDRYLRRGGQVPSAVRRYEERSLRLKQGRVRYLYPISRFSEKSLFGRVASAAWQKFLKKRRYAVTEDELPRAPLVWQRPFRFEAVGRGRYGCFSSIELTAWINSTNFNFIRNSFMFSSRQSRVQSGAKVQFLDVQWFWAVTIRRRFQLLGFLMTFFMYGFLRRPVKVFIQSLSFSVFGAVEYSTRRELGVQMGALRKQCGLGKRPWARDRIFLVPFGLKYDLVYLLVGGLNYFLSRTSQHKGVLRDFFKVVEVCKNLERIPVVAGVGAGVRGPLGKHARTKVWRAKVGLLSRNQFYRVVDSGQANIDTLYGTLGLRVWVAFY